MNDTASKLNVFNPLQQTIVFQSGVDIKNISSIINTNDNILIYSKGDPVIGGYHTGNTLSLLYNTRGMSATDRLEIAMDSSVVSTQSKRFSEGFSESATQPSPSIWDTTNTNNDHIVNIGGNSSGSNYLRIILNPLKDDSEYTLTSKDIFSMPVKLQAGVSISQRIIGQEVFVGFVGDDGIGGVDVSTTNFADKAITGTTISVTSNVATVTLTNHGLRGGDRITIYNCPDNRLNAGPVVATIVDANSFTYPLTIASASYNSTGGFIRFSDPLRYAYNGAGNLWESATTTTISQVSRKNGEKYRLLSVASQSTSVATQTNTSPYTDAFNTAGIFEQELRAEDILFRSITPDGVATPGNTSKFNISIPDDTKNYRLHIRARNMKNLSRPIARIAAISKTGTTTATVTTDVEHNLTTDSWIQTYGVRDITNFPNLTAATQVASIISPTQFTIVIAGAVTANSAGSAIWVNQGLVLAPGALNFSIQSIQRTSNVLSVTLNTTVAGLLPGEYVWLYGLDGSGTAREGAYKVLRQNAAILELEDIGTDYGSITCGGVVIKTTDVRIHFVRAVDYTRNVVEVVGGRGNSTDINAAVPVAVTNLNQAVTQSTGLNTTMWAAGGWGGFLVNDVTSAAINSTATTAATSPGSVVNVGTTAHSFNIIVTAVSGTPTLDVGVEESIDNGTNWLRIYDFPRITATGAYTSPVLRGQAGTRYRYVQTIGGGSPSFTRAINRIQMTNYTPFYRQFIDRTVSLTTLSSVTPTYNTEGADTVHLEINVGAITTTAPQLQLEGSGDNGTTWYSIGSPLLAAASSTVVATVTGNVPARVRARVSVAGSGVTAGYVLIKAIGN
jgi:hypothetical protein